MLAVHLLVVQVAFVILVLSAMLNQVINVSSVHLLVQHAQMIKIHAQNA